MQAKRVPFGARAVQYPNALSGRREVRVKPVSEYVAHMVSRWHPRRAPGVWPWAWPDWHATPAERLCTLNVTSGARL
jgi:hypothetical protein